MTKLDYRYSLKLRLSVLFSPMRLVLFIVSVVWLVVFNSVYISSHGALEWTGSLSVFPILVWVTVMLLTDVRHRQDAKRTAEARRIPG